MTIFTPQRPSIYIDKNLTIWHMLETQARETPDKAAFVCGLTDRTLTFAQVLTQAKQIVAGLAADGIKRGDVVILHSFNCIEYPIVFFALNRLGAICSPSSPLFNAKELADQIELAKAVAVISHKAFGKVAIEAAKIAGVKPNLVYTVAQAEGNYPVQSIEELIAKNLPFPNLAPINPKDIVVLPFSSGTTGRPKGVELTGNAMYATGALAGSQEKDTDYALGMLPFFHILAMMIFQATVYKGVTLVVLPGFEPVSFLKTIVKFKMEKLALAPPLILFLAKHPIVDQFDLSHVRYVSSGGAPLGKEVEELVKKRLGLPVLQGYGMTEFAGAVSVTDEDAIKRGSSGRLLPNTEMKVKSLTTDEDLPANATGELLFRTPTMMSGYFNNPEANRVTFTQDGFIRTGDIGYIDDDGFIFIVDRLKELIKYKGHQVAPAELEDVLNNHPEIADSCCVRGKDKVSGEEIPKAYVVRAENSKVSEQEVMDYVASKVTGYKKIRDVEFIDVIPKSLAGKILRRQLQEKENAKVTSRL